jgi:hypothetical protein
MYGALLVLRVLTRKYEFRDDVSVAVALYLHGWPLVVFRAQHQARCSSQSAAQARFLVQLGGSRREGTQHPRDVGNGSSAALGCSRVGGSCLTCLLFASGLATRSWQASIGYLSRLLLLLMPTQHARAPLQLGAWQFASSLFLCACRRSVAACGVHNSKTALQSS